ncbi:MAG: metalloendopeptidase-like rane protein [Rhodoglobus sp.]|nr:metalloendopeptidase-like rane protein [Rhodoglobus sp.]
MIIARPGPVVLAVMLVAALAGCTGAPAPTGAAEPVPVAAEGPGEFTPLTATVITPPTALPGSDGQTHLAFELLITNTAPRSATLTRVTVADATAPDALLADLAGDALLERTALAGDLAVNPTVTVPAYSTAFVTFDAITTGDAPATLRPTVSAGFAPPSADQPPYVSIFPDDIVQELPVVPVLDEPIVVIGPALKGGDWAMVNACCILSAHRGALLGRDGSLVAPERYAIDFVRIGEDGRYFTGNTHTIESDLSYGAELLAVADGTVIAVSDELPDQPVGVNPVGYSLDELAGNKIVLKLGPGLFALYAHNEPGSPLVEVGDTVKKGDVLALLGNSGNSTAPHLHFHLMSAPQPLNSDGVPYVWDEYDLLGQPDATGNLVMLDQPQVQKHRYALATAVIRFAD